EGKAAAVFSRLALVDIPLTCLLVVDENGQPAAREILEHAEPHRVVLAGPLASVERGAEHLGKIDLLILKSAASIRIQRERARAQHALDHPRFAAPSLADSPVQREVERGHE